MVSHCGLRFFYVYTKYFGGRYCIVVLSIDNIQFLITCTHSHISTNKMHVIRHGWFLLHRSRCTCNESSLTIAASLFSRSTVRVVYCVVSMAVTRVFLRTRLYQYLPRQHTFFSINDASCTFSLLHYAVLRLRKFYRIYIALPVT